MVDNRPLTSGDSEVKSTGSASKNLTLDKTLPTHQPTMAWERDNISSTAKGAYIAFGVTLGIALMLLLLLINSANEHDAGGGLAIGLVLAGYIPVLFVLFSFAFYQSSKSLLNSRKKHIKVNALSLVIFWLGLIVILGTLAYIPIYQHIRSVQQDQRCQEIANSELYKTATSFYGGGCPQLTKD